MRKKVIQAAKLAAGPALAGAEMKATLSKVLNAQATLSPAAFREKIGRLSMIVRATLIALIDMELTGDPSDRAQLEKLRKALE